MGDFKPLMRIGGQTLLEASVESLLTGGADSVIAVLGHRATEVESLLKMRFPAGRVGFAHNGAYATTDMLHSIQVGVTALSPCDAFYLLPGDMPAVGRGTYQALAAELESSGAKVAFPTLLGRRKHPPLIRADCIADILAYHGEGGLRGLWQRYSEGIVEVAVEDPGCGMDADTEEEFERLCRYLQLRGVENHAREGC